MMTFTAPAVQASAYCIMNLNEGAKSVGCCGEKFLPGPTMVDEEAVRLEEVVGEVAQVREFELSGLGGGPGR